MNSELGRQKPNTLVDSLERERLLTDHLPDVRYIAQRIHERLPGHVPLEDLVHAGIIGLIEAVDRFDPSKHTQLAAYAKFRIRGAILDSLRTADWSPRSLRKRARAIEEANRSLSGELGRSPSEAELAERLSIGLPEFQKLLSELNGLNLGSLDSSFDGDSPEEQGYAYRPNGPDEDPFFVCLRGELKSMLTEAISILEERERQVVSLYYFEELTMKEVGEALEIGESRVSQIHSLAIVRLRTRLTELLRLHQRETSTTSAA